MLYSTLSFLSQEKLVTHRGLFIKWLYLPTFRAGSHEMQIIPKVLWLRLEFLCLFATWQLKGAVSFTSKINKKLYLMHFKSAELLNPPKIGIYSGKSLFSLGQQPQWCQFKGLQSTQKFRAGFSALRLVPGCPDRALNCLIWLYKRSPSSTFFPLAVLCSLQFVPRGAHPQLKTNQCHWNYFGGATLDINICRYGDFFNCSTKKKKKKIDGKIAFQRGNVFILTEGDALCQFVPAERWFAIFRHQLRCWWQAGPEWQLWLKSFLSCMAQLSVSARAWLARFPSLFIKSSMP